MPDSSENFQGGSSADIPATAAVTQRKVAQQPIVESEGQFRLLVEGAHEYAMFLLDPERHITYWSIGAERVFGWAAEEAVGKSGDLIFTPEDIAKGAVEKEIGIALRDGRAPDRRFHLRKDGSRFWADGVLMRVDHESGEGVRGFAKIARDATEQREAEEALRYARDEMEQRVLERTAELVATNAELQNEIDRRRQLEHDLLEISERERRRVGQDLHDIICQELTATALFLKSAANTARDEAAVKSLNEAAQIVNRNVTTARDLARGFQPAVLGHGGLPGALRHLCTQANANQNLNCELKLPKAIRLRDEVIALNLYRVTQEAVANAVKHADATEVLVCIERERDLIRLVVEDNGKGFRQRGRTKGLGIHIMKYRASVLGGTLMIDPRPRRGTKITCEVPVKKPARKK